MGTKWTKSPPALVNIFYEVMENFPEADLKKMFGYPCAFYQGNMFIGLHQNNLIVRLAKNEIEEGVGEGSGTRFEPMEGRVMKEYLSLSQKNLSNLETLLPFVEKSWEYVCTLPKKEKKGCKSKK